MAQNINIDKEAAALAECLHKGDPQGSHHLARLIEADHKGVFKPFAEALAARLRDRLERWAELGVTDPDVTIVGEIYDALKVAGVDWDGLPHTGRPGEEA